MRIAFFDTHRFDRAAFEQANAAAGQSLTYFEPRLTSQTAGLAAGFPAVCSFVNDRLDGPCLRALADGGTRLVALRSAGFNHVDLREAARLGLAVTRVPEYSPQAVAEHTAALVLALNRKVHRAYARVRDWNFSLDGLVGFDLCGKTVALVGLGRIGRAAARIFRGFGCRLLGVDPLLSDADARALGLERMALPQALEQADIVSLHVPLTPGTRHLIDAAALARMKPGAMFINTSRGALVDSHALLDALKAGHLGAAGLDVYEEEEGIFFQDLSDQVLQDDVLARLLTFPNVLVTAHQGFLTQEALRAIARTTLESVGRFERGEPLGPTQVQAEQVLKQ
ncbi:2-hydroxyacid dehydrogenase [Corallococcus sp. CA047B]|uniref:2-hydroxyacid dehydrogenase n=1 Tax=Corallococcus sp. CA047B TaxID=2316729 RepID=UPI000EA2851E|nr:2-hydroxyacid dehydrogenase [Corallococcus sp. CA047B]RKH18818.1 2-hydroxyacid dehydrogenase [Corallococcus sp. CA047B]